jgi:plasmid stability protein
MKRRLELSVIFDYQRPLEVRAMVMELRDRLTPEGWAMLEAMAIEVGRQSALDPETAALLVRMAADPASRE